jgi:hypothetical protein
MVNLRCKMIVKTELKKLGIAYNSIELGEVQLTEPISNAAKRKLKLELHKSGLELMQDKKAILIEKIINTIIEMIHYSDQLPIINFSTFLSEKLELDFHKIADVFSKRKVLPLKISLYFIKLNALKNSLSMMI